jgi:hypothetical protein
LIKQLTQYTLRLLGHVCDQNCAQRVCAQLRSLRRIGQESDPRTAP